MESFKIKKWCSSELSSYTSKTIPVKKYDSFISSYHSKTIYEENLPLLRYLKEPTPSSPISPFKYPFKVRPDFSFAALLKVLPEVFSSILFSRIESVLICKEYDYISKTQDLIRHELENHIRIS